MATAQRSWLDEIEEAELAEVSEIEERQALANPKPPSPREKRIREVGIHAHTMETLKLSPKQEMAMRMYATGQLKKDEMPAFLGQSKQRVSQIVASKAGQSVIAEVRGDLEHRFQTQFEKVLNVIDEGLVHPEPSVALAAANMWFKNARATRVEVKITAEDLIGKIMSGEV